MEAAFLKFTKVGGSAEKKLGEIQKVSILEKFGLPIHPSRYNPNDPEEIICALIKGSKRTRRCHIYSDGTGTISKSDTRF
ncbi:tubulin folding cofactor-like protein [Apiospora arundinis]|uniref:Tubulin folding cofactor-like protein n=1 Tax=Apiospora arundinis TaxID=335852 RepID=A0ABR2I9Q3_9PEZI